MDEGDFDEAIEVYTSLGDYKDSQEKLLQAKYGKAKQYSKEGEKFQAIELYKDLGDYMDSKHLCELLNEELLASAEKMLLDDEDYKSSRKILVELNGYGNSEELLEECDEQEKIAKTIAILVHDLDDDTIHLENNNKTTGYSITIAPGKEALVPDYVYLTIEFPDGNKSEKEKIETYGSSSITCSALLPEELIMPGIVTIRLYNDKNELISEKKVNVVGELPEIIEDSEEETLVKEDLENIYSGFSDFLEAYDGNIIADLNEGYRIVFHVDKDSHLEKTMEDVAEKIGAQKKDNAYTYNNGGTFGNNFISVRASFDVDDQQYRISVYKNDSEEYCGVTLEKGD
ncbi:MAG: hypothetical protein Q4Q22_08080 [Methanosphaera sp.]|nr:hypothetical protein [Methanosphaera sp.]